MRGLNQVEIIGRIGNDLKFENNRTWVSIAVSGVQKRGEDWEEKTTWVPVTFFSRKAEALYNYATKGSMIFVRGRIDENEYQGKKQIQIIGADFILLSKKEQQQAPEQQNQTPPASHIDDGVPF